MKDPFLDTDHGFSHEDVLLLIAYIKGNIHLLAALIFSSFELDVQHCSPSCMLEYIQVVPLD